MRPLVSGAPAALHSGAVSWWLARGFHAPRWFFCLGLRVMATNRLFRCVCGAGGDRRLLVLEC
jgi:hypothetical protein